MRLQHDGAKAAKWTCALSFDRIMLDRDEVLSGELILKLEHRDRPICRISITFCGHNPRVYIYENTLESEKELVERLLAVQGRCVICLVYSKAFVNISLILSALMGMYYVPEIRHHSLLVGLPDVPV
ncbi:hypothetical protein AVEN_271856-1 [Araneus ventricosus]|uniref:Uncharacterized protein n=1 Tax=Araneus ventricosus TaxID=182803 RepID=A0A4Y2VMS8_ARAVE|nr:hypothetical protein AVEN_271856-1 [Araneus ventricosus]